MLQFTDTEILNFKERLKRDSSILDNLKQDLVKNADYLIIPKTGIATWEHYYVCPKDSVKLIFNIKDGSKHLCPACGEYFTGEPYDGAWWRIMNNKNRQTCSVSGLIYNLTGDTAYYERAKFILTEYAKYYPQYEVHGGIPYNNPGKANAQTLCEANWIRGLLGGYDFIRDDLTETERNYIEENLLTPAAEHLIKYRTNQIHNHEIIVNVSIGILGLLLKRPDYLDFAVNEKYGLKYQLEHGLLKDGLWFEGSIAYHFYAFSQYIDFEHFARNTEFTFLNNQKFLDLFKFPIKLMRRDFSMPMLNDTEKEKSSLLNKESIYEFMYKERPCAEYAFLLSRCYNTSKGMERNNLQAFLYGAEDFQPVDSWEFKDYHNEDGSGLTVFHGESDRYLLVKHSPYGGEHDHYDRLGICFTAFGKQIAPDIGTCAYGAPLHYAYYKNTGSHNTVCINGKNQPPANCEVLAYEHREDYILLDTLVNWGKEYTMPDSFTIKQWDNEAYKDVSFRRRIFWFGDFFVDICKVAASEQKDIDLILHVRGNRLAGNDESEIIADTWGDEPPYRFLKKVTKAGAKSEAPNAFRCVTWDISAEDGILFDMHCISNDMYFMEGPDNPSVSDISYLIQRKTADNALFVNVAEAYRENNKSIVSVRMDKDNQLYISTKSGNEHVISII